MPLAVAFKSFSKSQFLKLHNQTYDCCWNVTAPQCILYFLKTHLQWKKKLKCTAFLFCQWKSSYIDIIILLMTSYQQPILKLPIHQFLVWWKHYFVLTIKCCTFFFFFSNKENISKYTFGQNIWALNLKLHFARPKI